MLHRRAGATVVVVLLIAGFLTLAQSRHRAVAAEPPVILSIVTGAGPGGGPHVRTFNANGQPTGGFFPYAANFGGGVRVAAGQLDSDGVNEIITAAGPGGGPHVRVFSPAGSPRASFFPYAAGFTGGVFVAAGDINGDGFDEIFTGAGEGGGPHVRVFNSDGGDSGISLFAYGTGFQGGVRVASADVDGDGNDEIITGAGPGGGPNVKVFDFNNTTHVVSEIGSFFAYGLDFSGGVFVAGGDIDNDGKDEIITGAGKGGGPHVKAFAFNRATNTAVATQSFFAYGQGFTGGVAVGAGIRQTASTIITGAGPGGGPHVRTFDGATPASPSFFPYDQGFGGGVWVAGADLTRDDNDNDNLSNDQEDLLGTNPDNADSDGDGIDDDVETNGGQFVDSDNDGTQDALDTDSDADAKPDSTEGAADCDGDGKPNYRDSSDPCSGVGTSTTTTVGGTTTTTVAGTTTTTACPTFPLCLP